MPELDEPWGTTYSSKAFEQKKALPGPLKLPYSDFVDAIVQDPDEIVRSSEPDPARKEIHVYSHPDVDLEVTYQLDRESRTIRFLHIKSFEVDPRHVLFISYAHEDKRYRDELRKWLQQLEDNGRIQKIWDDQEIRAGALWEEAIHTALAEATAAILLVSQDFFFSDFVKKDELPRLLERARRNELKLLWVAVRSSSWSDSPLEERQALHSPTSPLALLSPPEQDAAFYAIYDGIKKALAQP